ncbi:MAG TPA: pre-toxin TG domain-containing protein, partial [Chryseosolibacter sp.]|nr:pre-toxin TG domain-containing protein [Chryseosolibacter sp.]
PRPAPAPEPTVREPSAREMFLMLLKELRLTEEQFNALSEQMQKEQFTDEEIADMFANAYFYPMYEQALIDGKVITLRAFYKLRKREAEFTKNQNAQLQRFITVDPREIKSTIFTASGNEVVRGIHEVLKKIAPVVSVVIDFIPVVGQVKGLIEAAVGVDLITGRTLADWERALAILPGGIEHSGKIVSGLKLATRAAAKAARSPQLLVVLTLAVKSGKHPVDIIENMKAVATMSQQVVSAAAKEIKTIKQADKVAITTVQRAALGEVAKAIEHVKKIKPSVSTVSAAKVAAVTKPVAIVGKHVKDLPVNGTPDAAQRMVDAKRSGQNPVHSSRNNDPDALPVSDKKTRRNERRKKKKAPQPKAKIPSAEETQAYANLVAKGWTKQDLGKSVWTPWGKYQTKHSGINYEYVAPFGGRTRQIDQLEIDKQLRDKLNLVDYKHHKEVEHIEDILKKSNNKFDSTFFRELEKSGHYRGFADKIEQFLDQVHLIRQNGDELNKIIIRCSDTRTKFIYTLVRDNLYGNIYKRVKGKFVEDEALKKIVDAIEIVVVK